jgi:hypothetical protein
MHTVSGSFEALAYSALVVAAVTMMMNLLLLLLPGSDLGVSSLSLRLLPSRVGEDGGGKRSPIGYIIFSHVRSHSDARARTASFVDTSCIRNKPHSSRAIYSIPRLCLALAPICVRVQCSA